MLLLTIALSTAAASTTVEHRGARYDLDYRPHVRVAARTVGVATGARPSTQRCRWAMTVAVERSIRGQEGRSVAAALLPHVKTLGGSHAGDCVTARGVVERAQLAAQDDVRAHVAAVAAADRDQALAALDDIGNRSRS